MRPDARAACLVGMLSLLSQGGAAAAQSSCDEEAVRIGNALRRAGRDEEALEHFRQAWEACHTLRARAQMALAANAPMMTKAGVVDGRVEAGILPTGQVVGSIEELPTVAEVISTIVAEAEATLTRLA